MADLTAKDLENLHKLVIEKFKVDPGSRSNLLEAIAARPNNKQYGDEPFPDVYSKAASIMEAIIRWHPFTDGNKRTALLAVSTYLDINGYVLFLPLHAVRLTVKIAENLKIDPESNKRLIREIASWLVKYTARKDDKAAKLKIANRVARDYRLLQYVGKSGIFTRIVVWVVKKWLAVDIYPQYEKEMGDIVEFLGELINKSFEAAKK